MAYIKTTETNQLMPYCQRVAVGSEIQTNKLCGQNWVHER